MQVSALKEKKNIQLFLFILEFSFCNERERNLHRTSFLSFTALVLHSEGLCKCDADSFLFGLQATTRQAERKEIRKTEVLPRERCNYFSV
jgi:hypothetical protein